MLGRKPSQHLILYGLKTGHRPKKATLKKMKTAFPPFKGVKGGEDPAWHKKSKTAPTWPSLGLRRKQK